MIFRLIGGQLVRNGPKVVGHTLGEEILMYVLMVEWAVVELESF